MVGDAVKGMPAIGVTMGFGNLRQRPLDVVQGHGAPQAVARFATGFRLNKKVVGQGTFRLRFVTRTRSIQRFVSVLSIQGRNSCKLSGVRLARRARSKVSCTRSRASVSDPASRRARRIRIGFETNRQRHSFLSARCHGRSPIDALTAGAIEEDEAFERTSHRIFPISMTGAERHR